jgi:MFS family permease
LLMLPLIARPALASLISVTPGTPEFSYWIGLLFWIPAIAGGIFGLLGGYLTDRYGRRRVLVWSILLYAGSAFAAGFTTSVWWFLFFRCTTFIGVSVEFVAAVAWLAEMFSDPKLREKALGYTQAFSSIGGLLVTGAYFLSVRYADALPAIYGQHEAWRYTLMSGVIPALPLILIRPFLPESPAWAEKKAAGTLRRPSVAALFSPDLRRTTIITTLMVACSYGAAFGAIQQIPGMVPGLPEVASLAKPAQQEIISAVQSYQEIGGLVGRFALAFFALLIVGRRNLLRVFQVPGLIIVPLVFLYPARDNLELLKWGVFFAGFFTVAQFSFWGNYLPRVFPTHLRGTGESFAANIGGRMLGTSFAFVTTSLLAPIMEGAPPLQLAKAATLVVAGVYGVGVILSFFLPEPKGTALPE